MEQTIESEEGRSVIAIGSANEEVGTDQYGFYYKSSQDQTRL